jgi:PAS domain S-box-containing protein
MDEILALLQNAAMLLGLVVVYDLATGDRSVDEHPRHRVFAGLLVGAVGIAIMSAAMPLQPGLIFDTRSVLLANCGLFLGTVPTLVAMAVTAAFRASQGGFAAGMGIAVIGASGLLGLACRRWCRRGSAQIGWRELYGLGLVVHAVMLALLANLPPPAGADTLSRVGLPVMAVHPLATVALGLLLVRRQRQQETRARLASSEARHRESERSYRLLFEANPHPMWIYDTETLRFLEVNEVACARYGWSREEFLAMTLRDLRGPSEADSALPSETREAGPSRHRTRSGEVRDVEVSSHEVDWQGRPARMVLAHDVTERHRAELARLALETQLRDTQKIESIGRLAGGVAHDFNNALGAILARTDLARKALPAEAEAARHLDLIAEVAQRSARLTRQLLAFARRDVILPRRLDLDECVDHSLSLLRPLIGEDVSVRREAGPGSKVVKVDPSHVDQVLTNLVVNARDAGAREIRVETAVVDWHADDWATRLGAKPGRYVRLRVVDDGSGMTAEVRNRIFEPFFTTKPVGQGTGLGLSMVYGIARQNGGYVECESLPGRGASFDVLLPSCALAAEAAPEPARGEVAAARGEVVLVVEDEAAMLSVTTETLTDLGYRVLAAAQPDEALSLAASFPDPIDLLVTDVVMPGLNGRELAARLRAARPGLRCLFVSGYTADVIEHRGVLEEGVQFLAKPFSSPELARKVREALGS